MAESYEEYEQRKENFLLQQKRLAARKAAKIIARGNYLVIDTETTGIEEPHICSIAIVDENGAPVFESLINPQMWIPESATNIHGITNEMVIGAPTFAKLYPMLRALLHGQRWLVYNLDFERRAFELECWRIGRPNILPHPGRCVMKLYAQFSEAWSEYHRSFSWQKLSYAVEQHFIHVPHPPHSAMGDALSCYHVVKMMAEWSARYERMFS